MTTQTKRIIGAVVGISVIGGIVAANVYREARSRTEVQIGTVERHDLTQVVTASGEVRPKRYVNVGANVSGRIVELRVREGDTVEKGQVLARIESERYEAGERQSRAAVEAAQAAIHRLALEGFGEINAVDHVVLGRSTFSMRRIVGYRSVD